MARVLRLSLVVLFTAVVAAALAAREAQPRQPAGLPAGWHVRFDDPSASPDAVRVEGGRNGLHIVSGPAGLYYRNDKVRDSFVAAARFTQPKPAAHASGYGLFIGGTDLEGAAPSYTAFLIRQDGRFAVLRRDGAQTRALVDWTEHAAIFKERKPDEKDEARDRRAPRGRRPDGGMAGLVNVLEIDAEKDTVRFLVNGAEVASLDAADVAASGLIGVRVETDLDLMVEGPEVRQ